MNKYGFIKVCAASVYGKTADTVYNCTQIINTVKEAAEKGCSVIVFPELSITSYSCQDLFHIQNLKKVFNCFTITCKYYIINKSIKI